MSPSIHPTACVGTDVKLGAGVSVGPYAVIESGAEIGDGCRIEAHAVIHSFVRMGRNNHVCPQAVIGGLPQDLGFDPFTETYVEIGDGNVFREGVSVSRATRKGDATRIGANN